MIKLTFLGDMMCCKGQNESFRCGDKFDFSPIFKEVKALLEKSDLVFANIETPLTKDYSDLTDDLTKFNTPIEFAQAVKASGVNVVTVANNHCLDRGVTGIYSTINCLEELHLQYVGLNKNGVKKDLIISTPNGVKIGILGYTYGTNYHYNRIKLSKKQYSLINLFQKQELSYLFDRFLLKGKTNLRIRKIFFWAKKHFDRYNWNEYERPEKNRKQLRELKKDIRALKRQNVDIIIMLSHLGGQFRLEPTPYNLKMTQFLKKKGVNIVATSHEHLVQKTEKNLDENFAVAYCLGNFCGTFGISEWTQKELMCNYSIAWHVYLDTDENKGTITKTTYSVLKSVENEKKQIITVPCNILYNRLDTVEKNNLVKDVAEISMRFCGKSISTNEGIKEEYEY